MNDTNDIAKDTQIETIMRYIMGHLFAWKCPKIVKTVGPYFPDAFDGVGHSIKNVKSELSRHLNTLTTGELLKLIVVFDRNGKPKTKQFSEEYNNLQYIVTEIEGIIISEPVWFSGGFGNEEHKANFEYWAKMDSLSLVEATCLTIGFAPESFNETLFSEQAEEESNANEVLEFFKNRGVQINRKFLLTDNFSDLDLFDSFGSRKVRFEDLQEWVVQIHLDVPTEFTTSFQKISDRDCGIGLATAPEKFDHREKASLSQLLTAFAISELGYDPNASRSPIPKEIQDMAAKLGLEISDDTIRKYLKLGASHLPDGWQDD